MISGLFFLTQNQEFDIVNKGKEVGRHIDTDGNRVVTVQPTGTRRKKDQVAMNFGQAQTPSRVSQLRDRRPEFGPDHGRSLATESYHKPEGAWAQD